MFSRINITFYYFAPLSECIGVSPYQKAENTSNAITLHSSIIYLLQLLFYLYYFNPNDPFNQIFNDY
ncbi:hypothetical protein H8356DRAFT_1353246 [Neocallimastix lanati (nom. inval.)]|nr:hypothetical protein H8356DRAFT_1353246 [Neocallimastix sp. JGI-2020a]